MERFTALDLHESTIVGTLLGMFPAIMFMMLVQEVVLPKLLQWMDANSPPDYRNDENYVTALSNWRRLICKKEDHMWRSYSWKQKYEKALKDAGTNLQRWEDAHVLEVQRDNECL